MPGYFKESPSDCSKEKSSHVCHVSDTAGLCGGQCTYSTEQLREKPKPNQHQSRDEPNIHKPPEDKDGLNLVTGISDQECPHDCGDCTTGPQVWNGGSRVDDDLS